MRKGPSFKIISTCNNCLYMHKYNKELDKYYSCSKLNKPIYPYNNEIHPHEECPYIKEQYKQHLMFELGLDLKTTLNLLGYKNVEIKEKTLTVVIANILETELDMLKTLISGYKFSAIEPVDGKLCIRFVKKDWP